MLHGNGLCILTVATILLATAVFGTATAYSQHRRDPPVDFDDDAPSVGYKPADSYEEFTNPSPPLQRPTPSKHEFRLLPRVNGKATWLFGDGASELGISEYQVGATTMLPVPFLKAAMMVTPSFGVTQLNAPAGVNLPNELYRVSASIMFVKKPSERLTLMLGATPGVSSDFEATDSAFRVFAHGAATYQWTSTTQIIVGAAYLNRNDISLLPMAGLIWTPNEDWRIEVTAPRPRIARRLYGAPFGTTRGNADCEAWVYVAGELGGGTWAVSRGGADDELTIRDFRIIVGYETKTCYGLEGRAEVGYVFGRSVDFENDLTEFEPDDTFMVRTGVKF